MSKCILHLVEITYHDMMALPAQGNGGGQPRDAGTDNQHLQRSGFTNRDGHWRDFASAYTVVGSVPCRFDSL